MDEKVIIRQTVQTQQRPRQSPSMREIPYQFVFRVTFSGGAAVGILLAYLTDITTIAGYAVGGIVMGLIVSGGLTYLYVRDVTLANLIPDVVTKTEEYAPSPGTRPLVEPFRISGNGYTAVIDQPEPGHFVRWACEVLDNSKSYFSQNQALERGFDYRQVVDGLRRVGVLAATPDRNNVYHVVSGNGRQRLEEAIGRRTSPAPSQNE